MNETTIAKKSEQVELVANKFKGANSIVFVDYLGLTVEEITQLRVALHKEQCELKVVKNNILLRAAQNMGFGNLANTFVGPSAAAFSKDEVAAAKVLFGYAKDHEKLKIKAGIVDGKVTSTTDLKTLSTLPNKTGLVSMLLSALQGPARNLAYALKSVSEKK